MCWTISQEIKPRIKTAKKDITVYKEVHRMKPICYSSYPKYELGKFYFALNDDKKIIKRIRCYQPASAWTQSYWRVDEGVHSYDYRTNDSNLECIIPKGTKYLYNPRFREYVSMKIKPIRIIRKKKMTKQFVSKFRYIPIVTS